MLTPDHSNSQNPLRRRDWLRQTAFWLSGGLAVSCKKPLPPSIPAEPPVKTIIATTSTWLADLARLVGGEHVGVTSLLKPGEAPTLLKRSGRFEGPILTSEIALYHGMGWDDALRPSFDKAKQDGIQVLELASVLPKEQFLYEEGKADPHVWLDPTLWKLGIDPIAAALKVARPAYSELFETQRHGAHYVMDQLIQEISSTPQLLVTSLRNVQSKNPSLAYLARVAGLQHKVLTDKPEPQSPAEDLGALEVNWLQPPGTKVIGRSQSLDLSSYEGWIKHCLDLMILSLRP